VDALREAKQALHGSRDVDVPGDLLSRLCAIPFTADVPGATGGGLGAVSAGPGELTVTGTSGSWSMDLAPQRRSDWSDGTARWLRRGLVGTLTGLGVGVTALALNLPPDSAPSTRVPPSGPVAGSSVADQHTEVVPPVVRTVTVGRSAGSGQGGTP
jgi:hypothetical protein